MKVKSLKYVLIKAISFIGVPEEPNALVIDIIEVTDVSVVDNKNNIILVCFVGSEVRLKILVLMNYFCLKKGLCGI